MILSCAPGKLFTHAPVDAGADQLGKRLMRDSLPPRLSNRERQRTVEGDGEKWNTKKVGGEGVS